MKVSSLGTPQTTARRYQPRPPPPPVEQGPIIEYTDTKADVMQSYIVLAASVALALGSICFNIAFLATH